MLVKDAIGQSAESIHLRMVNDRTVVVNAIDQAETLAEVTGSFAAIGREVRRDERGSWNYLTAHVALILVYCWRLSGFEDVARQGFDSHSALLVRFRHLVETHFRERWRIADYARELGVSHDRLHDICVRLLQRTPLELLHDRLGHEAGLRLARSGQSIEALADYLGFRSASHFSRFFKLRLGFTPAAYRKAARDASVESRVLATTTYADWP
jgi:AraC-like DNA-binding protein